ncbi:MAG: hypothetical protein P1V97_19185 [Planctomycetota bacterium]|nr:hypothetical protein [Planctomycetota bacterium]
MELHLEQSTGQKQPQRCIMCHDGGQTLTASCHACGALYHAECLPMECATLGCSETLKSEPEHRHNSDLEPHFDRAHTIVQAKKEQRRRDMRDWRLQGIAFVIIMIIIMAVIWGPAWLGS